MEKVFTVFFRWRGTVPDDGPGPHIFRGESWHAVKKYADTRATQFSIKPDAMIILDEQGSTVFQEG
jgi:hypothetical protein